MLKPAYRVLLVTAVLAVPACKSLDTATLKDEAAPAAARLTAPGLDVNDVSFLFPLPQDVANMSQMPALSTLADNGKPIMSEALFNDIIGHFAYDATIDGEVVKLNAGVDFTGKSPQRRPDFRSGSGPFNVYSEWHIMGMRYDPCAPSPTYNQQNQAPRDPPTAFDAGKCLPQIRMTAQPVMSVDRVSDIRSIDHSADDDQKMPRAADFTMHLVFTLTEAESRAMYQDLVAFRDHCGDLTSGVPFGIHPCLMAEVHKGQFNGSHQQELVKIMQKYAKNYAGASSMATRDSTDPWLFMNGFVQGDKFLHQPINAVRKEANLTKNSKGKVLEPFNNGYYEMLSFLQVAVPNNGPGPASFNQEVPPITPAAVAEKVNKSFSLEFNRQPDNKLFISNVNKVENPLFNDFFSTDCASCHGASELAARSTAVRNPPWQNIEKRLSSYGGGGVRKATTAGPDDPQFGPWSVKIPEKNFYKVAGYTNILDNNLMSFSVTNFPYAFIHFGYLKAKPSISMRNVNESVKVAKEANDFYGTPPTASCPTESLRACMYSNPVLAWSDVTNRFPRAVNRYRHLYPTAYCMTKVCSARAKALQSSFGPYTAAKYQTLQDITVVDGTNASINDLKIVVPSGTVITGFVVDQGSGDTHDWFLSSPEPIPGTSTADGTAYIVINNLPLGGDTASKVKAID